VGSRLGVWSPSGGGAGVRALLCIAGCVVSACRSVGGLWPLRGGVVWCVAAAVLGGRVVSSGGWALTW